MHSRSESQPKSHRSRWWAKAVAVLLSGVVTIPASADWDDRSDELPGISSVKSAVILGAAVGGGAVLVVYLLKKRGGNSDPQLDIRPSNLNYGAVANGRSSQHQFTVTNTSSAPITVETIAISGTGFRFASQPAFPITLEPGKSAFVPVSFAPASPGKFSARVEVRAGANGGTSKIWKADVKGKSL